jgi:tripartite-type tricarboxylate transporter receptor subunit TctC
VHLPDIKKHYAIEGGEPIGNAPEEFARWLKAEIAKWAKVIKATNVKVE